jgi:hypothetical protein
MHVHMTRRGTISTTAVLFEHQNTDIIRVYNNISLIFLSSTIYAHFKHTQKLKETVFDI